MFNKTIPLLFICLLIFACNKQPQPSGYQAMTTMNNVSEELNFQPQPTEIINTTSEEEMPRYILTNQPVTEDPVGVSNRNQQVTPDPT